MFCFVFCFLLLQQQEAEILNINEQSSINSVNPTGMSTSRDNTEEIRNNAAQRQDTTGQMQDNMGLDATGQRQDMMGQVSGQMAAQGMYFQPNMGHWVMNPGNKRV